MVVHHLVAAERLKKPYFRRWLYWHGISRALLFKQGGFDLEEPELQQPPHAGERQIGGVPAHLLRKAIWTAGAFAWHSMRRDVAIAFEHELWLCFLGGVVRQRWADRHLPVADGPATKPGSAAAPGAESPATLMKDRMDLAI